MKPTESRLKQMIREELNEVGPDSAHESRESVILARIEKRLNTLGLRSMRIQLNRLEKKLDVIMQKLGADPRI